MPCPECGAAEDHCETYLHQMLFWEAEFPELGAVHHLAVLCFHLQHPSRYSAEGLGQAQSLLVDFVARGKTPQAVRQQMRDLVAAGKRPFPITARSDNAGGYAQPIVWTMTAADVVAAGSDGYIETVRRWAESMLRDLRASGHIT